MNLRPQWHYPRRLLVLDDSAWAHAHAAAWLGDLQRTHAVAWFGDRRPEGVPGVRPAQAAHWLGREVEALVFEIGPELSGDALAIAAGLVRGGGVFVVLLAALGTTPFAARLRVGLTQPPVERWPPDAPLPIPGAVAQDPERRLNADQRTLFSQLIDLPQRPSGSCAVLTAPRGRGKSTVLGVLARHWLRADAASAVITAPNPGAIRPLLRELNRGVDTRAERGLASLARYQAPDQRFEQPLAARVLLVDEAAALPVPVLLRLAAQVPRTLFATTTTGFEGSGRGFRLRFLEALARQGQHIREYRLKRPVRWPDGDLLEAWVHRLFLLEARVPPVILDGPSTPQAPDASLQWLSGAQLASDEARLTAVIGLLSDAHYRTRPSDLQRWLDGPGLHIGLLHANGANGLLGVVLAQAEPGLDAGLARAVWAGERRPQGHFLPCVVASHGARSLAQRPVLRVLRIAIHPDWQCRGLGRQLLQNTIRYVRHQGFSLLGASFGARPDLLRFWMRAGLRLLRIGFRRETTSGLHAAVVLCGLEPSARDALDRLLATVAADWPVWRAGPLRGLEAETAELVSRMLPLPGVADPVADAQVIQAFAYARHPYELALPALQRWYVTEAVDTGRAPEDRLLDAAVRQLEDWPALCRYAGASGRGDVIRVLRLRVRAHGTNSGVANPS